MPTDSILTSAELAFLAAARTAVLATIDGGGMPRLVPICFVIAEQPRLVVYTPLDEKPKRVADARDLARVRDILERPEVALLVDRWSEDWTRLGWLRLDARGVLLEPEPHERDEHTAAVADLRAKYPQYTSHALEDRPIIRLTIDRAVSWGDLTPD